ncbi:MAG: hypothetical protein ACTSSN_11895 [Candidatus Heimdallarchaeaceae archaeon]
MLQSFQNNPLRIELLKVLLSIFLILTGGVILGILIPIYERIDWLDFLFYSIVGILIIVYLSISLYVKKKKFDEIHSVMQELETISTTSSAENLNQRQKAGVKVNETAAAYCPMCKKSYGKTYQFCPNCGYCGIIKKLK